MTRTYEIAQQRLIDMENQRAELDQAIAELKQQMELGKEMIASAQSKSSQGD